MNKFKINANEYLKHNIISYYHIGYTGYKTLGNPDYLNDLKNTFGDSSKEKLDNAKKQLYHVLKTLSSFNYFSCLHSPTDSPFVSFFN